LGSVPHPQAPFVRSLYLVVEAQSFPLYFGGAFRKLWMRSVLAG